jgi:N-acetylglucosamine malate deacetylase 1
MTRVLVIGAHPDDEVLGCGGTMARLSKQGADVHILLLADGESARGEADSEGMADRISERRTDAEMAARLLGCRSTVTYRYPDNRLDSISLLEIVRTIERHIEELQPGVVFAHHCGDVNVDHRRVHEATLAACRPQPGHPVKELLFYEVASSTEWRPPESALSFAPNVFYDISATFEGKIAALNAYASEMRPFPHPRSLEAVRALAQWRGATVGVPFAEAFVLGRRIN